MSREPVAADRAGLKATLNEIYSQDEFEEKWPVLTITIEGCDGYKQASVFLIDRSPVEIFRLFEKRESTFSIRGDQHSGSGISPCLSNDTPIRVTLVRQRPVRKPVVHKADAKRIVEK